MCSGHSSDVSEQLSPDWSLVWRLRVKLAAAELFHVAEVATFDSTTEGEPCRAVCRQRFLKHAWLKLVVARAHYGFFKDPEICIFCRGPCAPVPRADCSVGRGFGALRPGWGNPTNILPVLVCWPGKARCITLTDSLHVSFFILYHVI